MKGVVEWIQRRPVIAFYITGFAISWGLWLPLILSHSDITELFAVIGLFGPALACVIVARIAAPHTSTAPVMPFWLAFLLGWMVSTLAFFIYNMILSTTSPVALLIFAVLAIVPAYIIASAVSGPPGVRRTLSSLVQPKGAWGWIVLALALPLLSRLVSVWLAKQLGWELLSEPLAPSGFMEMAGSVIVVFLYTFFYAGGVDEETGWTGLALPRLLGRFNPVVTTVIVWALWMLWHVPMHLSGFFNLNAHVLIGSFFGRFLLTWLFIRSSGSVLTALLLHTAVNVTSQFVPLTYASLLVDAVIALLVIVDGKMWRQLPGDSPAVLIEEHPAPDELLPA